MSQASARLAFDIPRVDKRNNVYPEPVKYASSMDLSA